MNATKGLNSTKVSKPVSVGLWLCLVDLSNGADGCNIHIDDFITEALGEATLREYSILILKTPELVTALTQYFHKVVPGYPVDCKACCALIDRCCFDHPEILSDTAFTIMSFCQVDPSLEN